MMLVPNFQPRISGVVINNYFNCKGGVKDCNCDEVNVRSGYDTCRYFPFDEKPNIYEMEYKDLAKYYFRKIKSYSLRGRLKLLTNNFKGEIFLNHNHKERFYNAFHKQDIVLISMIYLLDTLLFFFS